MTLSNFTPNKATLTLLVSILAVLMWIVGRTGNTIQVFEIPSLITESESCSTKAANNRDTFVAFMTGRQQAEILLKILCNNPIISRQFGNVQIHWSFNEQDMIQYIGKGLADLALVKENVMQAFATEQTHGYQTVAHYRNYAAYLISLRERPEISKQYLWGKRLGLLDYPSSRSGHIIPKQMLKELGLNLDDLQIVYANSHSELRELLSAGDVDIISSYWKTSDQERFSQNYITPIQGNVTGSRWYLKMETRNTDLICGVQEALREFARTSDSDYFTDLIVEPSCTDEADQESE